MCGGVAVCGDGLRVIPTERDGVPGPRVGRNKEMLLQAIAEAALSTSSATGPPPELSESGPLQAVIDSLAKFPPQSSRSCRRVEGDIFVHDCAVPLAAASVF